MSVTVEISDDLLARLEADPSRAEGELLVELAIALYRDGKLPAGIAAELGGLKRDAFETLLIQRQVPMPYSVDDLEHDLAYGRSRG